MGVARTGRIVLASTTLLVSQSIIFGIAVLPALVFWQFIREVTRGFRFFDPFGWYVIVATSLIPAYLIFSLALMFTSAGFNRLMRWRTEAGEYAIHDYDWRVIRWACYNASISVVRIFCGEPMRVTPFWTYYLKANGAKIGPGVYVNTARLNDHNLLILEEKAVVGGDAKLIAHLAEKGKIKAEPVILRKRAVVGVNTVIGPGVEIGEGSAVGAMSFVPKGTKIPPNQAWGGVPARPIKQYEDHEFEKKGQPGIPIAY
jgi:acetyltransferase-like isoleucine patch superfamily enzyme